MFGSSSTSGFGRSASTGGIFGTNSNTAGAPPSSSTFGGASSGGLFGANNASSTQFGSNNTISNNTTGGFGGFGAKPTAGSTGTSGGLFGGTPTASTTGFGSSNTSSTGGVFGNNNTNATSNSGGLFGSNTASTTAPTSGGLFGAKAAAPATGGLFGNSQPQSSTTGGSLFGAKPAATSGGLFGNTPASTNTTTTGGGLFGNSNANISTGSVFGASSLFNTANQNQLQPQSQQVQLQITPLTTIGELPEAFRKELEQYDQYIQNQVQIASQLKSEKDEHTEIIESIPRDIDFLQNKYSSANQTLGNDVKVLKDLRESTDEALHDSETFFVILQRLLTAGSKISSHEIDMYFNRKVEHYTKKLEVYTAVLSEIDSAIESIEKDSISDVSGMNLVISTLHEEFHLFMELANNMAEIHQKVKKLQERSEGRL